MKYLTKEWYILSQQMYLHNRLKPSERAASFSEEYSQELYAQKVQERLDFLEQVNKVDLEDLVTRLYSAPVVPLNGQPVSPKPKKENSAARAALIESLRKAPRESIDPQKEEQFVRDSCENNLRMLELCLPDSIKRKVADMRVLALGRATQDVIDEVAAFCEANKNVVNATLRAVREENERNFRGCKPGFMAAFDWHDAELLSVRQEEEDFLINFKTPIYPPCIHVCRFKDAGIIHRDPSLEGAVWLYDEIYPLLGGGYEIHALLHKEGFPITEDILPELILRCRDVEISSFPLQNN